MPKTLPPSRHPQRADATAEANIAAAHSNDAIAASIEELRRDLAPKEPDPETLGFPLVGRPAPAEHLEAAE